MAKKETIIIEAPPLKIYLEEPIEIKGIKVAHTKEGLIFLIKHWTSVPKNNRSQNDEMHLQKLIENWKINLKLYEDLK